MRVRVRSPLLFCLGVLLFLQSSVCADTTLLNFEGFPDSTVLTNQYPGLTFSNTIILTAGIGLNELELPPHSGSNVAFDNNAPIAIGFSTSVTTFSAYFTYVEHLTIIAFDAASHQVGEASSAFSSNDALFGDPGSSPNEFLSVSSLKGISSLTITADRLGNSFAMDDITYSPAVPEPHFVVLSLVGFAAIAVFRRIRSI
jgi:hypothetical protein